jgi:hypothetical protein
MDVIGVIVAIGFAFLAKKGSLSPFLRTGF